MSKQNIRILYVDDEEHNLHSFKAAFRRQYDITTTVSVTEAEQLMENNSFNIVLADQRMPIMTGVQFFEKIREKFPDVIRILITGHTDISAAIDAINKGEVFRFIHKPWDFDYVENAIDHAYDIFKTREDLRERNIELQKANEELDKFVYSASHDLRAPLMSILGIVNLAVLEEDPDSHLHYFDLIRQSVKRLDTFVINIIDYYKNARGLPIITNINFEELVQEVISTIQFLPEFEGLNLSINITQEKAFFSDVMKLRIIFNNLINNAIKFQDSNKPNRFVNLTITTNNEEAVIIIEDNGTGIKDDDVAKIFKMFYRADALKSGSGIGLYIVQEAVNKLEGQITATSQLGKGSTFRVVIPSVKK